MDLIESISYIYGMNPIHLAAFRAVVESGGFVRAAELLHISQPAVSSHVAALELDLGVKLINRLPTGGVPTEAGRLLLTYAKRFEAIEAEARTALVDLASHRRGRLTVGASTTVGVYLLPLLLGRFHETYPDIELTTVIDNTEHVCTQLIDGVIDLGMTEGEPIEPSMPLNSSVVHEDELVLIAPPKHPLVSKKRVTAKMLAGEGFIEREPGSGTRAVVEHAFADAGINRRIELVLGHTEAIKRSVAAGLGVAVVSNLTVRNEADAGTLAVIRPVGLRLKRPLWLLTRRGYSPSPAAAAFVRMLKNIKQK